MLCLHMSGTSARYQQSPGWAMSWRWKNSEFASNLWMYIKCSHSVKNYCSDGVDVQKHVRKLTVQNPVVVYVKNQQVVWLSHALTHWLIVCPPARHNRVPISIIFQRLHCSKCVCRTLQDQTVQLLFILTVHLESVKGKEFPLPLPATTTRGWMTLLVPGVYHRQVHSYFADA